MTSMIQVMSDLGRSLAATVGLYFAWLVSTGPTPHFLLAQQMPGAAMDATIIDKALQQGGAVVIVLVVLFFYRRDYMKLNESLAVDKKILIDIITELTKSNVNLESTVRGNSVIVEGARSVLSQHLQRAGDLTDATLGPTPRIV